MATYYVNGSVSPYAWTQGTYGAGADGAGVNGSLATPWATMQYAESRLTAGDIIHVAAGTYNENDATLHCLFLQKAATWVADGVVIVRPYSNTSYTVIAAGTTAAIAMTGFVFNAVKVNGATDATYCLYLNTGSNNKTFTNCSFINALTALVYAPNSNTSILFTSPTFSGSPTLAAINAANIGIIVNNINVVSFSSARIFYHTADTNAAVFNGGSVVANLSNRAFQCDGDGILTISNITATIYPNVTSPGSFVRLGTAAKTGALVVSGNTITFSLSGAASAGHIIDVAAGNHPVTITGNIIDCDSVGQVQSAINILNQAVVNIDGNTINYGATGNITTVKIQSTATTMAVSVTDNIINSAQALSQVLLVGTDVSSAGDNKLDGAIITGNTINAPLGGTCHCLEYGYNKNGVIAKNKITGGGYGIVIKGNETYTSGGAFQNVVINSTNEGMRVKGVKNLNVFGNLFINPPWYATANGLLYVTINSDSSNATSTGTVSKGNIFVAQGGINTVNVDANSASGFVCDNNLHFMETGVPTVRAVIGATTYTDWATWQGASFDVNGVNADPLFVSSSDYHLLPTSPCIGAGIDVGLTEDADGNPVPGPAGYSIGPYEYMSEVDTGFGMRSLYDNTMPALTFGASAPGKLQEVTVEVD